MLGIALAEDLKMSWNILKQIPWSAWKKFFICLFLHKGSNIDKCNICNRNYFPKGWKLK